MAITGEGIYGDFTGRLGNLVFYRLKGKMVVRTMPQRRKGITSPALKKSQDNFALVMKIMQALKSFVKPGFHAFADPDQSAFHAAKSYNLKSRRSSENPGPEHWLSLSVGERAGAESLGLELKGQKVVVSWQGNTAGKPSSGRDMVLLGALNTTTMAVTDSLYEVQRNTGSATLSLPGAKEGEKILVYIAFQNVAGMDSRDLKNISTSQLAGIISGGAVVAG
jgi:hypothetical protein